ncbi:hypothetical protein TKK_0014574 [Trichogramma kaykai]
MNNSRAKDIRPAPAEIEFKNMKFLITDRPNDQTIHSFIQELKNHKVKEVVRVCEPTYETGELKSEGINVIDLLFEDGTYPPNEGKSRFIAQGIESIEHVIWKYLHEKKQHDCILNFNGSGMEADGAVELVVNSEILKIANIQEWVFDGDNDMIAVHYLLFKKQSIIIKQADMNHSGWNDFWMDLIGNNDSQP